MKYGLAFILRASLSLYGNEKAVKKAKELIEKYGADCPYKITDLLPLIKNDKKAESEGINAVFVKDIGDCRVQKTSFDDFEKLFV